MTIESFRVHWWLSVLFATSVMAAISAIESVTAALLGGAIALATGTLTLRAAWTKRHKADALKWASDPVLIAGMFVFVFLLFTAGLVPALLGLLCAAQIGMNLVFRLHRHLYFSLMVTFAMLMFGASRATHGGYLLFFLLYCISGCLCLGYAYMDRQLGQNHSGDKTPVWRHRDKAQVALVLMALALGIYLVMPRLPAANIGNQMASAPEFYQDREWEQQAQRESQSSQGDGQRGERNAEPETAPSHSPNEGSTGYEGFSDRMDIRNPDPDNKRFSNAIVARMRADRGAYLRVETFDRFDGVTWSKTRHGERKRLLGENDGDLGITESEAHFQQQIQIEQPLGSFVPATAVPALLHLPASVVAIDDYGNIRLPSRLLAGTHYTVESATAQHRGRPLAGRNPPPRQADLALPDGLDPRIEQLAESVTSNTENHWQAALALEEHLRTEYDYSLESVFESQNQTPLPRFLFEDREGHCEFFASALAVMLRTQDIPARLVTGFSATDRNPLTGYYEIRALDGHAWVEAWIDGVGWVLLEPTAFYQLPQPEQQRLTASQIQDYAQRLQEMETALGNDREFTWRGLMLGLWELLYRYAIALLAFIKLALIKSWTFLAGMAAVGLAGYLLWRSQRNRILDSISHWKVNRYRPSSPKHAADFYMGHLQAMMARRGLKRPPGMTIEAYILQLAEQADLVEPARIVAGINQLYYGDSEVTLGTVSAIRENFNELYRVTGERSSRR